MELCIQLSIIMVGKQAMNTLLEMAFPLFFKWLNLWKLRNDLRGKTSIKKNLQWVKDFKLIEWGPRGLFPEYLEMGKLQLNFNFCYLIANFVVFPKYWLIINISLVLYLINNLRLILVSYVYFRPLSP